MKNTDAERMDHDTYHRLEDMFAEGYRAAQDKLVYLRLAHIPFELPGDQSSDSVLHLKYLKIEEVFEAGNVTPAFGSHRLIHQMYPHELVKSHKSLTFVYVNHSGAVEKSLRELLDIDIKDAGHHD